MFSFIRKRLKGAAVLETALTLPVVMYCFFAAIEMIRIGLAQVAVDSIAKQCALSLMGKGTAEDFDNVFREHKPISIPLGNFRFYVSIYPNLGTMTGVEPYGGEAVGWPGSVATEPEATKTPFENAAENNFTLSSNQPFIPKYGNYHATTATEVGATKRANILKGIESGAGMPFVLTVSVKFPFSSSFVSRLFANGTNTDKPGVFILWSRVAGMINTAL